MESIRKGWKGVSQEDAKFQHPRHGGEYRRPASTVPQNLVGKEVRKLEFERIVPSNETTEKSQKDHEIKNIGLGSGSVRQAKTSDAFITERSTMELKRVALGESVETTSETKKKGRFTTKDEMQWQTRLQELQEFRQTQGHCRVPQRYSQNPSLGKWVSTMRNAFKRWDNGQECRLTTERIAALNNLGFDWDVERGSGSVRVTTWKLRLKELREFHQTYGHCRVPQQYPNNPSLGYWVKNIRTHFRRRKEGQQSSLTAEHIGALNNLGFNWVVDRRPVDDMARKSRLQELQGFRLTHGHQQQHRGQKEVATAVPRRLSEEEVVDNESYWV